MSPNSNLWIGLACLTYGVLYLCVAALHTRHNRVHQYRNEHDIEIREKKEGN